MAVDGRPRDERERGATNPGRSKIGPERGRGAADPASSEVMGQIQSTTEQFVERARQGDRDAQQALWQSNRRWVAAIILAHRPRSVEVDDLMQDVAVKMVSKIQSLREVAAFRPWLRQITINVCRGAARGLRPTLQLATESPMESDRADPAKAPVPAGRDGVARTIEDRDAARRLYEQALTLPTEYREPLLLRCVRSMSYQQISEVLELPITTIETRLARARRMLRDELPDDACSETSA